MQLCEVVGCPCYASDGTKCAAHSSQSYRVPRKKTAFPVKCSRCGGEIAQGDWAKPVGLRDVVHGGYACKEKA